MSARAESPAGIRGEPDEPYVSFARQRSAATFGIWVFLASEVLFFGALLLGYTVYRSLYWQAFHAAGGETDIWYGSINTAILLTSSATMATAAWAGPEGLKRTVLWGLALTAALGLAFLVVKGFEYREDIHKHLVPGSPDFPVPEPEAQIFFSFYWLLTGIHAIHLTIGVGAIAAVFRLVWEDRLDWSRTGTLHVMGLYWHLIDIVWIFLFPLLYLMGRG